MSVKRICEAIVRDEKSILPVSSIHHGGKLDNVAFSMPMVIGKNGVETLVPIRLSEEETDELIKSVQTLKDAIAQADIK